MERWKSIQGYPHYEVSDHGRVKNSKTGRILKQGRHKQGYSLVWLSNDGRRRGRSVHSLVGEAFVPNPNHKPQINHKDGVKSNNYVDNLEWSTGSENTQHAYDTGLFDGRPKVAVKIIETEEIYDSVKDCAEAIGGSPSGVSSCASGRFECYKGLHFEYVR